MLRHRIATEADGVVLTMVVRGNANALLELEERLGTHPLVRSFEALANAPGAPIAPIAAKVHAPAPVEAPPVEPPATSPGAIDHKRVERLLPQLARSYPNMFLFVHALEHELDAADRAPTLRYIGQRVGAWVYKRDFSLGAQLTLAQAIRHIALPAMRQVVQAELLGESLEIPDSPFPHRGQHGACCHFLAGMLDGLLRTTQSGDAVRITETRCRNTGAAACRFEFRD
ncbi:hypothetical protein LYSHEL_28500 [Lysobacter helvus]|uniref:4-vinyl reductase 4VR domain-containing protein n=2 Tax=Lysobacteraceae TaxID=32033 RepID=A0ABN6G251_9GAMM|nr:hypothetical protein LYSCAS_28470 [Lysobacter caseinilyticus]BCT96979.1 hypothetical protein LYSHEL_28500 [Lysobacter helvus]